MRHSVARVLCGLPEETVDDVLLALDEAVSNAIRHGSGSGGPIEVSVGVEDGWIDVLVLDRGPTPRPPCLPDGPPRTLATGGRGLWLIAQLVDEVRLWRRGDGTLVWLRRRARPRVGVA